MSTMDNSPPDTPRDFIEPRRLQHDERPRELIRRARERVQLRALIAEGAEAPITGEGDARYFAGLRQCIVASKSPTAKARPRSMA